MATQMKQRNEFKKVIEKINQAKTISIFTHTSYDLDGLGSLYGLYSFLKKLKKKVFMFVDSVINITDQQIFDVRKLSTEEKDSDLYIMVDCTDAKRLGKYCKIFQQHHNTIRLDHHKGFFKDANIEITLPYCSTAEVILNLIELMGYKPDKIISTYLFAGLVTDSDSFRIETVNKLTYENALKLISFGADNIKVNDICFKQQSLSSFKLIQIMSEKMEIFDGDIAISSLNSKDFKRAKGKPNECTNFSKKLLYLQNINISCLIKQEQNNVFSCSFRSKGKFDVSVIAEYLGGGGHFHASACKIHDNEKNVKQAVINAIRKLR